jgi:predicted flavoprotein YhiN
VGDRWLTQILPKRLVEALIDTDVLVNKTLKQFNPKELYNIVYQLENWVIKPNGTEGYRTAEVTLGGIDTTTYLLKQWKQKK